MTEQSAVELGTLVDLATPYAVRTAVTLGLPDLIASGVTGIAELAERSGAVPDALARLMRHLVDRGVFAEPSSGLYALTDTSRRIVEQDESWRDWMNLDGPGATMDLAFAGMAHSMRTGGTGYAAVHGVSLWEDIGRNPKLSTFFNAIMAANAWQTIPGVTASYDWSAVRTVVDVGGGAGALLSALLTAHPHLTGTLVDLPTATPEAQRAFADAGLGERARVQPGDFFGPLPEGADVYLVSRVLTDWDDERATAILASCAAAAPDGGRVLVVEVLPGVDHEAMNTSFDLQMLTLLGGRQRDVDDFDALAGAAGLVRRWTASLDGGLTLIEYGH